MTFTVGLATFDQVPESVEAAIEKADCLMYEAKRMGKNTMRHSLIGPQTQGGNA